LPLGNLSSVASGHQRESGNHSQDGEADPDHVLAESEAANAIVDVKSAVWLAESDVTDQGEGKGRCPR
jgi:hypothetical protein